MHLSFGKLEELIKLSKINDEIDEVRFNQEYKKFCGINGNLKHNQIRELSQIYGFLKIMNFDNDDYLKNVNFSIFEKVVGMECDLFFHFHDHKFNYFVNVEIKNNNNNIKQLSKHFELQRQYLTSDIESFLAYANYNFQKKCYQSFITKNGSDFIKTIYLKKIFKYFKENNIKYSEKPSKEFMNLGSMFLQLKNVTNETKIFTKEEEELIQYIIKKVDDKFNFIIIDAKAGVGKTLFCIWLLKYFNQQKRQSKLFINNYRFSYKMNVDINLKQDIEYICDNVLEKNNIFSNKEILIVDEAHRVTIENLIKFNEKYKTIILFGDKNQIFCRKFWNDYENLEKIIKKKNSNLKIYYKKYESSIDRRFSRHFPILIEYLLNSDKYKLPKNIVYPTEDIILSNSINEFIESYCNNWNRNKKFVSTIKDYCRNLNLLKEHNNTLTNFISKEYPTFFEVNIMELVGTSYNIHSFDVDEIFMITSHTLDEIKHDKHIFCDIYTLCTRIKKRLVCYFIDKDTREVIRKRLKEK